MTVDTEAQWEASRLGNESSRFKARLPGILEFAPEQHIFLFLWELNGMMTGLKECIIFEYKY